MRTEVAPTNMQREHAGTKIQVYTHTFTRGQTYIYELSFTSICGHEQTRCIYMPFRSLLEFTSKMRKLEQFGGRS